MGESTKAAYIEKNSVAPGGAGTSVIAAHSNHKGYATFNHLRSLRNGDMIVITKGGQRFVYQFSYKRNIPIGRLGDAVQNYQIVGGPSRIVLETCDLATYDWAHHPKYKKYNYYTRAELVVFDLVQ